MSATYEEQRTEQEKRIDADVLARVKRGLAWLEETHGPGWEDKIDLATLRLEDSAHCVLGQVYESERGDRRDGWSYATDLPEMQEEADELGFDKTDAEEEWSVLQEAWEFVLRPRVTEQPQ